MYVDYIGISAGAAGGGRLAGASGAGAVFINRVPEAEPHQLSGARRRHTHSLLHIFHASNFNTLKTFSVNADSIMLPVNDFALSRVLPLSSFIACSTKRFY